MSCLVADCERDNKIVLGYCPLHYRRFRTTGDPLKTMFQIQKENRPLSCTVENCQGANFSVGLCNNHYRRLRTYGDPLAVDLRVRPNGTKKCSIEACEKKHNARGYCNTHYHRWKKYGDPLAESRQNGSDVYGYVYKSGKAEHRRIMEELLGRKLLPNENVHHKNGVRSDNRIENLELWSKGQPAGQRIEDKVNWAIELLELYAPEKLRKAND
jgi:hypothetical protein